MCNCINMPFEVGGTINKLSDKFLSAPVIHNIARNPIYTALLITFIVMLIIMFIFRDADTDESLLAMCLRAGFWIFFMLLGVLLLHNKILGRETSNSVKNSEYENAFLGGYSGVVAPGQSVPAAFEDTIVPVHINTNFTQFT